MIIQLFSRSFYTEEVTHFKYSKVNLSKLTQDVGDGFASGSEPVILPRPQNYFFSLIVFGGPEAPFLYLFSSAAPERTA